MSRSGYTIVRERLDLLEAEHLDLLDRLAVAEQRAHKAARVMYRKGYLAGHSAGSRGVRAHRGPYRKTRTMIETA